MVKIVPCNGVNIGSNPIVFLFILGHDLVLIADYLVREHAETDGETSKQ